MLDLVQATQFLVGQGAHWETAVARIGPCTYAPTPRSPYEALLRALAFRGVRTEAGRQVLARFLDLYPEQEFPSPFQVRATPLEHLRACGFSPRTLPVLQAVAQAALSGRVPSLDQAMDMSDLELMTRLGALPGVGKWTVEMLMIFSLGRSDVLPVEDRGVREGFRHLCQMERRPARTQLAQDGLAWRPYRTVAAWYLWRVAPGYAFDPCAGRPEGTPLTSSHSALA